MYSLSNDALTALQEPIQMYAVRGTVGTDAFTHENILKGSLTLSRQIVDTSAFCLGGVYISQLSMTLIDFGISRNDWVGLDIAFDVGIKLADDTFEYIPMGTYTISKVVHDGVLAVITAYDYMSKFDVAYEDDSTVNTLYGYLTAACTACGVTLGMTQAEVEALPNGDATFSYDPDVSDISTYRDLLSWLAVTAGGYCAINRDNELELRVFHDTVDDTITADKRYKSTYGDQVIHYTAVNVTVGKATVQYSAAVNDGYALSLGKNPFMQGTDNSTLAQNILAAVDSVCYNSCKVNIPFGAHYDCGDVLQFTGGNGSSTDLFCVLSYVWKYNGDFTISSMPNPNRSVSRSDKTAQSLASMIEANSLNMLQPVYESEDAIADGENNDVAMFVFSAKSRNNSYAILGMMIAMDVTTAVDATTNEYDDATVTATILLDDVVQETFQFTYGDGKQVMTLNFLLDAVTEGDHILTINLAVIGGAIA